MTREIKDLKTTQVELDDLKPEKIQTSGGCPAIPHCDRFSPLWKAPSTTWLVNDYLKIHSRRNNDGIDRIPKTTLHCNEYIEQGGVVVAMCDKPNSVIAKYRQHIGKQAEKAKSQKGVNSFINMDYSKTVKRDQRGKLHGTPPLWEHTGLL